MRHNIIYVVKNYSDYSEDNNKRAKVEAKRLVRRILQVFRQHIVRLGLGHREIIGKGGYKKWPNFDYILRTHKTS